MFGYLEVERSEVIEEVMAERDTQAEWDEVMDPIIVNEDNLWMDEVYRMR